MLFPKGPRFVPDKVSDVPGPNAYNIPTDSLDTYKRGAFLEKTDRFSKEKQSEVPGPGTHDTDTKPPAKPTATSAKPPSTDRYAIILRRLEELEKVHADDKKSHHLELERSKFELARLQKANTDQSERIDKLKKQNDAYDLRLQEYKRSSVADQSELKDLRAKVRRAEHENAQFAGKQTETAEAKKALQSLETKRKEDVREREKKIADLERTLATERKKREMLEGCLQEVKGKADGEVQKARESAQNLQSLVDAAQSEASEVRRTLMSWQTAAESQEEELVQQLEQCRSTLARVAEDYGRLASSTVAVSKHVLLKHEHATLQLRFVRLERKLANSEGQVIELANLVRYTKEDNTVLQQRIHDVEEEAAFYMHMLEKQKCDYSTDLHPAVLLESLGKEADLAEKEMIDSQRRALESLVGQYAATCDLYRLTLDDLLVQYSINDKALCLERTISKDQADNLCRVTSDRDAFCSELQSARTELSGLQQSLVDTQVALQQSTEAHNALEQRSAEQKARLQEETFKHKDALQKEREIVQKLTAAARMSKTAEEALQAEVEQLNMELTDVSRFQEAYYSLVDETEALLARNDLAEEEAERLSRFNAEILGHNNPAQRIMYVDRIRRELADVKQKLLVCTRERDTVTAANDDLRQELGMYTSAMIPIDSKPRTGLTRITRPPLGSQNLNVTSQTRPPSTNHNGGSKLDTVSAGSKLPLETIPGDMTLDEIM
ncbi:hypothetical protein BV22DRAFT_1038704 [Leucogyrophana mollusca]|uniref:Uncharacterized protein n=1 Tax=Leucogyrophana mollusca TaxID=85980 RepID=A0ACB8B860_9AGAM|nr:hypothetical protein BV22DRAFT_1038704 [Leucogyrophana mollusca]